MNIKIKSICMNMLYSVLKKLNKTKTLKSEILLGYNTSQLKLHLESFEKFKTLKDQNWHLDHIIPIKAFVENGITELKIINHLSNLQPLDSKTNLQKSGKYRKKDFHKYMKNFPEYRYNKNIFKYEKVI